MLIAKNIDKIFKQGTKEVHAVKKANIGIAKGERVLICGPSGAGKSTLLHVLGGLDRPTKGDVSFQDKSIYRQSDRKRSRFRNRFIGFVFQFYHLLPELSVLENVMLPAMIKGGEPIKKIKDRSGEILKSVNMHARMKHKPAQLSGGEIQRTAIARALINSPEVIFCDEPTGNLDSKTSGEIYSLIYDLSKKNHMGVVVVSHQDLDKKFFDSEYYMRDGELVNVRVSQGHVRSE
ncbi:MAG: ABC transporter ATP-binding protein [Candidatus Omnitrophica bacterium]|nr:ABC transporter ATP-binding protein [Candidatus Omnitrophota bacterium]